MKGKLHSYQIILLAANVAGLVSRKLTFLASGLQPSSEKQSHPYNYDIIAFASSVNDLCTQDSSPDENFPINRTAMAEGTPRR